MLVPTATTCIVVTGTLAFLAFQSAPISLLVASLLVVTGLGLPILMILLGQRPGASFVEARAGARTHCVEALQGREEIASYHAQERAKQQVARYLAAADQAQHAQRQLSALGSGLTTTLASTTTLGALLFGLWFVGQGSMSGPVVVMVCLIVLGLFESIEGLPLAYQFLGQTQRAAQRLNAENLDWLAPGSWANANFQIWIGHPEDHQAWKWIMRAREALMGRRDQVPEKEWNLAYEELLVAEGSDWMWWFGNDFSSDSDAIFDALFRQHIGNIFQLIGLPQPEGLDQPIKKNLEGKRTVMVPKITDD